jgi:hypothetical protein
MHATHSNTLKRNKKRIGDWFIVQLPTMITLTILKIGNPHMSQSRRLRAFK